MAEQDQQLNDSPEMEKGEPEQPENEDPAGESPADGKGKPAVDEKPDPVSRAQELVAGWEQEKQELIEQLQRERARFDNFRRISRQQQESSREYALFDFFKKLLPVLDDLERAIQSAGREGAALSHVQGLEMIYKQLLKLLTEEGVSRIEAEGRAFDPNFHHAVAQVEWEEPGEAGPGAEEAKPEKAAPGEPGTVAEELSKGYAFKARILRPSMVKVYK